MRATGVNRIIAVSAAPVGPVPACETLVNRWLVLPVVRTVLRNVYADLTDMEAVLQRSHSAWTVIRPPKLVDKPTTGRYRIALGANVPGGRTLSRVDAMLNALDHPETVRRAVGVA